MQVNDIPPKRQLHSYTWKPKNLSFNSTIALLNYLIQNNLVVVTERATPKCQYCGQEVKGLLMMHIVSKHPEKVSLK